MKKGILLVNLGTPNSPAVKDVRNYLAEFLMDPRVIDINPIARRLLVKGIIVPFRSPKSAKAYKAIWTENGSPLMNYSIKVKNAVQQELGLNYHVELAMRYQNPSLESALNNFYEQNIFDIKVVPMFPQYASATTGSINQKIMEIVGNWQIVPKIEFVNSYFNNPLLIDAFVDRAKQYNINEYDHVLFSFHGLPIRQLIKADSSKAHCQKADKCCESMNSSNQYCYSAQSYATAYAIAQKLELKKTDYSICFQSRLGRTPWIKPYTSEVIEKLAMEGKKRILVFCPAFVSDCLETIYEISVEYQEEFEKFGGEKIQLVEGLNDSNKWVNTLVDLIKN